MEVGRSDELGSGLRREKQTRGLHTYHTSSHLDSSTNGGELNKTAQANEIKRHYNQYNHMTVSVILLLLCNSSRKKKRNELSVIANISDTIWPNILYILVSVVEIDPKKRYIYFVARLASSQWFVHSYYSYLIFI